MLLRKHHKRFPKAVALALVAICFATAMAVAADDIILRLKNGDRIAGRLISQDANALVIATNATQSVTVPISAISGFETGGSERKFYPEPQIVPVAKSAPEPKPKPAPPAPVVKVKAAPAVKPPRRIHGNIQLGSNLQFGARDQRAIFARAGTTYARPYTSDPKNFFRATTSYSYDYGETENVKSANRMAASLKTDFDLNPSTYCYNLIGVGYDEIRKIDSHYEIGPGFGWHALKKPTFTLDMELGADYQAQKRSAGGDIDSLFLRLSESVTWAIAPRVSLSEKFSAFANGEKIGQIRSRFESTLIYKLLENLSLNITVTDIYDSNPAPNVDKNEFQIISSIGITF